MGSKKRDISFVEGEMFFHLALGISNDRMKELSGYTKNLLAEGISLTSVLLSTLNERFDFTDAEWTFLVYQIGYNWGKQEAN